MKTIRIITLCAAAGLLAACTETPELKAVDRHVGGTQDLVDLRAGIWVDPNGCDHWIIDDGVEGYLSQRLDRFGKPVCSGIAPPNTVTGPFKEDGEIADIL